MKRTKKFLLLFIGGFLLYICITILVQLNQEKTFKIIFIPKVVEENNDFWNFVVDGVNEAVQYHNVSLEIMAPNKEGDYEKQKVYILEAIEKKPDAIILAAEDYEKSVIEAQKIKDHGIKLIIIDAGIKGKIEDVIVATNNFEAGIKMGYRIRKLLAETGEVAIISHNKETLTAMEREKGIRTALSDIEERIVESYDCSSDTDEAYKRTIETINTYEDIKVIAALNQYTATGAARAIRELNLADKIKVVGFDNSKEQIKYLEEGVYDSLTIQNPFYMGYMSVEKAVSLLKGENVEASVNTGSTVVTKENMYMGMNQRLLFPFK